MTLKFFIEARFADLNDGLRMSRPHLNRVNSEYLELIMYEIMASGVPRVTFREPVNITFTWYEDITGKGRPRDPDNVAWAKKFILDALVRMEILANDSHKEIKRTCDEYVYGDRQGVEVKITE